MERLELIFPEENVVYQTQMKVKITDINYGGHLAHDSLITMLHDTRYSWFESEGVKEWDIEGKAQVIVSLQVVYKSEAFAGQNLMVELAIGSIGKKSYEIYQRVKQEDGKEVAVIKVAIVFFDFKTRTSTTTPKMLYKLARREET